VNLPVLDLFLPSGPARGTLLFIHGAYAAAWCWEDHFLPEIIDPQTGERVEFEGTADEAIAYATDHRIALDGCLSDDPETQAAQGVKFKVTAAGEWRWV